MKLSVADLHFPLTEIPLIDGELRLSGGNFRLPYLVKPLADIDLSADFKGGTSVINLTGLRIGSTVVRKATLSVEALKSQRFSVMIDMKNFEPADFATPEKRKFRIPVIAKESLMAKLAGDFDIRSERVADEDLVANDVVLMGVLIDRHLGLSRRCQEKFSGALSRWKGRPIYQGRCRLWTFPAKRRISKAGSFFGCLTRTPRCWKQRVL